MHVAALHIYPIKSCRGIALERARIERRGLANDRRFMLVDEGGLFITQRQEPRLALVDVALSGDEIHVHAPALSRLSLPQTPSEGPLRDVQVWRSRVSAREVVDGSAYFSRYLGRPTRLVYMPDDSRRATDPNYSRPDDVVSFADGYPMLFIATASLAALNAKLETKVTMNRFRPNVVVDGCDAFAEDGLKSFRIGATPMRAVKPCARCVITTIDPEIGRFGREPLRTLATFRKQERDVLFGVNVIPDQEGELTVGDAILSSAENVAGHQG